VREVVASPPVTRLPEAPPLVRGLANVHGTLVTAISGPRLLALEVPESGDWLVVLALHGGRVGIQVDEVEDVVESDEWHVLDVDHLIAPLIAES
jgi:chemotaxis signal transduction protein